MKISLFLFAGLLILSFLTVSSLHESNTNITPLNTTNAFSSKLSVLSSSISITDNNFTLCSCVSSGNGTALNPFVIKDLEILISGLGPAIYMVNVNKYFILDNITISRSVTENADNIFLNNVSNGKIINSKISQAYNIDMVNTFNMVFSNNTIFNGIWGINVVASTNITIQNNNITNNQVGIRFSEANNSFVKSNIFYLNIAGIFDLNGLKNTYNSNSFSNCSLAVDLENTTQSLISTNSMTHNTMALQLLNVNSSVFELNQISHSDQSSGSIYISNSNTNQFSGNIVSYNGGGFFFDTTNSTFNNLTSNVISYNSLYGLHANNWWNNEVKNNNFTYNGGYGTELYNSYNNVINNNTFIQNNNHQVQAYDANGTNAYKFNTWDDYTGYDANGDGIGDTPYVIDGSSGSTDEFPVMIPSNPTVTSTNPSTTTPSSIMTSSTSESSAQKLKNSSGSVPGFSFEIIVILVTSSIVVLHRRKIS